MSRAMTGSEIARELNISRQAVSQSLKRGLTKMYITLRENGITESPTETMVCLQSFFDVKQEDDVQQFIELFPQKIQREVKDDARNYKFETY